MRRLCLMKKNWVEQKEDEKEVTGSTKADENEKSPVVDIVSKDEVELDYAFEGGEYELDFSWLNDLFSDSDFLDALEEANQYEGYISAEEAAALALDAALEAVELETSFEDIETGNDTIPAP